MTRARLPLTAHLPTAMPISEAIEIEVLNRDETVIYVVAAWVTGSGMVTITMAAPNGGSSMSLANLQGTGRYPRKAVAGWQASLVTFIDGSIYTAGGWQ